MKISGRLQGESKITLPGEWFGKIDPETMVVQLTPFGSAQDLFVKAIDYGYWVEIRSQSGTGINCFYTIEVEPKK